MENKSIKNILDKKDNIPSMPLVLSQSLNLIDDPNSNIKQIAALISKDIALSAQVLKLVNSAYYGFPSQITTIEKAMALLGFNTIKNLILSVSVKSMMMTNSGKALWEHSIRCAVACQMLSKSLGGIDPDEAYIIGLLHDVGKSVMETVNKDAIKEINRLIGLGADSLQAEQMFFGFTHTDVGKEVVTQWKLPLVVGSAVRYHHNPLASPNKLQAYIVYIGDRVTREPLKYPIIDPDISDAFDFEVPDPLSFREQVFEASNHIISALS